MIIHLFIYSNSSLIKFQKIWIQIFRILTYQEYDISKPDSERQTALHYAAFIGNPEVCRALIRHGSQVDPKDQDGFTPLHRACAADRNEAVEILIEVRLLPLSRVLLFLLFSNFYG